LLATGVLLDQKRTIGDVIVITSRKSVALQAATAAQGHASEG
jgi:hypothetical protein